MNVSNIEPVFKYLVLDSEVDTLGISYDLMILIPIHKWLEDKQRS